MGPQEYQDALDALDAPDAPAPVKAAAKRLVERYSSAMAKDQLSGRSEASLAEGSTLGPTGLDAMQAGGLPTEAQADEKAQTIAKAEAKHPGIAKAFQARAPTLAPDPQIESGPTQQDIAEERGLFDNNLRNLSKRKELDAPTEFHPPTPTNPGTPFDSVWGKLSAAKNAMPDWAGGGTEHYIEPSVAQFQQEMAPVLGPDKVAPMAEGSPAYREYADAKWIESLQRAQAEGRSIVRDAFRPAAKGLAGGAADLARPGALQKAGQVARSADIGADEALTGGNVGTVSRMPGGIEFLARAFTGGPFGLATMAGEALADQASGGGPSAGELGQAYKTARQEKNFEAAGAPIAKEAGFALGALNPAAPGNVAAELTVGKIPGAIGGLAAGAVGGASASALSSAPGVIMGEQSPGEAAEQAGMSALYGAPLGFLGGALGGVARREGQALRRETDLGLAEQGGARMRPIRGVEPGPANRGLEVRARSEGIGKPNEPDVPAMLAHDLAEPFGKRAHAREGELLAEGGKLRDFEQQFAGEKHPLKNTIKAILDAKKKLVQSDGTVASVNRPEMDKLDNLLDDVMSVVPQAPEYRLEPKDPKRLDQLERSVDVHGELGTHAEFQRDVKNINEMSTPTRAITPQAEKVAASERSPLATAPDFGPYAEGLPGVKGGIEAGMAGERIRSLHETRLENPDAFDVLAKEAKPLGLGEGLAPDDFVRMVPRGKNPGDLRELVAGVRQRHESTSATSKEPFPDYDKIKRAFHQDRDAFTGETDAIKQSDTFTLDNGETVRGYSAANAQLENKIGEFENLLSLLGYKGGRPPNVGKSAESVPMENLARQIGQGGRSPEIDRAFRQMAAETGMEPTLQNLERYLAMKRLEQATKIREVLRFGGMPSAGMLSGQGARLRLDPVVQGAIPFLENAGSLGAVPGHVEQSRELPGMADQATLDEIRRALQP